MGKRCCYKGSKPKGKGYVAFNGDLNKMSAPKKMGLESIRVINQKAKKGGCRTRNGEALNSAFKGYYTKKGIWQDWGSIKPDLPKRALSQDRLE